MNDAPINKFEASDPHRHPRDDEYRTKSSKLSDHESKGTTFSSNALVASNAQ